jgi:uncharacterized protein (TIGR02996 family)
MSPADAFLAEILANPEDDAPRLVFADWLEDHGQPERAEFIRTQIELSRLPGGGARRRGLRAREGALLRQHGRAWRAELPVLPGVEWGDFERGLIGSAKLTSWLPPSAEAAFAHAPLRELELWCAPLGDGWARELGGAAYLSKLRVVRLVNNRIGREGVEALVALPWLRNLRVLDLLTNDVGDDGARALASSPLCAGLRKLGLANAGIGPAGAEALASSPALSSLRALKLGINPLGEAGVRALAQSPHLAGLRALALDGVSLGVPGARALADSRLLRLTTLRLCDSDLGDEATAALMAAPFVGRLEKLDLSLNNIRAGGARALAGAGLSALHTLDLGGNPIDPEAIRALARSRSLAALRTLKLSSCPVGDVGARNLASSRLLRGLTSLDMDGTKLTSAGLGALADSPRVRRLRRLKACFNKISDRGVEALARSPHLRALRRLDLACNGRIGDAGARALAASPHLKGLRSILLPEDGLGPDVREALLASFGERLTWSR